MLIENWLYCLTVSITGTQNFSSFVLVRHSAARTIRTQFAGNREKEAPNVTIATERRISLWSIFFFRVRNMKRFDRSCFASCKVIYRLLEKEDSRSGRGFQKAALRVSRKLSLERKVLVPWKTKLSGIFGRSTPPEPGARGSSFEADLKRFFRRMSNVKHSKEGNR